MVTTLHKISFKIGQKDRLVSRLNRILFVSNFLSEMPGNPTIFSPNTQKALARFQKKKKQKATGVLDEKTAILLEDEYKKSGFGRPYRIRGVVNDEQSGKGIAQLNAEIWVMHGNSLKQVAEDTTGEKGEYLLAFDEMAYADLQRKEIQPATFLIRVEKDNKLLKATAQKKLASGDHTVNIALRKGSEEIQDPIKNKPEERKDPIVEDLDPRKPNNTDGPNEPGNLDESRQEKGKGKIFGMVLKADRQPLAGIIVRAFDKNIAKDSPLGKPIQTNRKGAYEITYSTEELPRGKELPDIYVQVLDRENKPIGQSVVKYNAPAEIKINVLLSPQSLPEKDEYNKIKEELQGYLNGGNLSDLEENTERQDVTYLANKSGWDARIVAMASLAEKYELETKTPAPFFYALFRAGYPTDRKDFSKLGKDAIATVWKEAGKQNIIDQELETQIKKGQNTFTAAAASHLLKQPASSGVSSLGEMMNLANLNEEEKLTFTRLYINTGNDASKLWKQVSADLGEEKAVRLQTDGKLGYLTMDNAPLINQLYRHNLVKDDPVQLVENGMYNASSWVALMNDDTINVPDSLSGNSEKEKKVEYASQMANRLKISYPTAVLSHQIKQGEMPLLNGDVKDSVVKFLQENQLEFQIGERPLAAFLKEKEIKLELPIQQELKALERVYKITSSDDAMKLMLKNGIDSAMAITKYDQEVYIEKFSTIMSTEMAVKSYQIAQQVHATTLNTAIAYLSYKRNPGIRTIASEPAPPSDILAYPTLEGLFGEMDYCECSHCRSVLGPAAYMVDLLNFIDKTGEGGKKNPLEALLERRPDIEHLQLTCENTNTVLPYIDLVNEILEFFAVNANLPGVDITDNAFNPMEGYNGYNMNEDSDTSELIASPQYVQREAYNLLKQEVHPAPFNQPLQALRLLFKELEVPLGYAIETLRTDNDYASWLPVLLERIGLSPEEYKILSENEKTVAEYFGKNAGLDLNEEFVTDGKYAKNFTRSLDITYKELTDIVKSRFINPASFLLPAMERLYVNITEITDLIDEDISENDFNNKLPADLDVELYGGDVAVWIKDNGDAIKRMIFLTDTEEEDEPCNFEKLQLLFSDRQKITQLEYLKFYRFIVVWKKLGWTIEQTDQTFAALWPNAATVSNVAELNEGFKVFLYKLAHFTQVMNLLRLSPKRDLQQGLTLFADIDTQSEGQFYRKLFLNNALSETSEVFDYDPNGNVLTDNSVLLVDHEEAVLGALNLTSEKLYLLLDRFVDKMAGVNEVGKVPLTLPVLSTIYRYNLLARALKLSIEEVLILQDLSLIDPFANLTPEQPPIVRFIETSRRFKDQKIKLTSLTYYVRHEDLSGEASPTETDILVFAQQLTAELQLIESEIGIVEEFTADMAREKMSLLYAPDAVNLFFNIIDEKLLFETDYDHHQESLEAEILNAGERLTYNNFSKKLTYAGVMSAVKRDELKTEGDGIADPAASTAFKNAIDTLYDMANTTVDAFFADHPYLQFPYDNFVVDGDYSKLIEEILLTFKEGLKRQKAIQLIADTHGSEADIVSALLEEDALDSELDNTAPAISDFLALEKTGINVRIVLDDDSISNSVWNTVEAGIVGQELPANTKNLHFSFYLLAGEGGYYNLRLETEAAANVTLIVGGEVKAGTLSDTTWENDDTIYLEANQYEKIEITVENINSTATLKWATENGSGSYQPIPDTILFLSETLDTYSSSYLRFLKALALMDMLDFNATEVSYFGDMLKIGGEGFLKSIPLTFDSAQSAIHQQIFDRIGTMLYYNDLKEAFEAEPEDMVSVLTNPEVMITTAEGIDIHLLLKITGWAKVELDALLNRFGINWQDLSDPETLYRVFKGYELISQTGLSASLLIELATTSPDRTNVSSMENALRMKYDNTSWLKVIQPINDKLRNLQRNALVPYVLRLLSKNPKTKTVDTADKLFEFLLIDVKMDSCMKTSRIKQALSSIQLFVNRVLLNLEANVSPDSINKKQWVWMKRYRVWEANRKVFLYPENWLEPELRDNKSSFFKELEGELLQSEINEDTAHVALLHYLEKLDTIAKLEICAYFLDEKESEEEADDILHVIARTSGAKRVYYYRRQEYGNWTPWEKIDSEIEDNPVLPVVWNGRLFLFWLMVITQGEENTDAPVSGTNLQDATLQTSDIKLNLEVSLCWSEYFNNKWQPRNTSDINDPMYFHNVDRSYKRSTFFTMGSTNGRDGELFVQVNNKSWTLFNKNSNPEKSSLGRSIQPLKTRIIDTLGDQIHLSYNTKENLDRFDVPSYTDRDSATVEEIQNGILGLQHTLYKDFRNPKIVKHTQSVKDLFEARFFIQNYRHVFYVVPEKYNVPLRINPDYGWEPPVRINPDLVEPIPFPEPIPIFPPIWADKPILDDIPLDRDPVYGVDTNPLTQKEILPEGYKFQDGFHTIKNGMLTKNVVTFGDTVILPTGNANRIISTEDSIKNL